MVVPVYHPVVGRWHGMPPPSACPWPKWATLPMLPTENRMHAIPENILDNGPYSALAYGPWNWHCKTHGLSKAHCIIPSHPSICHCNHSPLF